MQRHLFGGNGNRLRHLLNRRVRFGCRGGWLFAAMVAAGPRGALSCAAGAAVTVMVSSFG